MAEQAHQHQDESLPFEQFLEQLMPYLDGELGPELEAQVQARLNECSQSRSVFECQQRLLAYVKDVLCRQYRCPEALKARLSQLVIDPPPEALANVSELEPALVGALGLAAAGSASSGPAVTTTTTPVEVPAPSAGMSAGANRPGLGLRPMWFIPIGVAAAALVVWFLLWTAPDPFVADAIAYAQDPDVAWRTPRNAPETAYVQVIQAIAASTGHACAIPRIGGFRFVGASDEIVLAERNAVAFVYREEAPPYMLVVCFEMLEAKSPHDGEGQVRSMGGHDYHVSQRDAYTLVCWTIAGEGRCMAMLVPVRDETIALALAERFQNAPVVHRLDPDAAAP